ncbi:P-loop containing nucleoside triphosphate hydrolase protein [Hypoxylon fuscum]|nr:P-loop containing nucleoside triphosphate hydrolase protein [Hypoxylon fuscum]
MDAVYESLATRACNLQEALHREDSAHTRIIIALAGPPGSGKSTIAEKVSCRINRKSHKSGVYIATAVPMDGFHYPRAHLDSLPNSEDAHARRGAYWTFDATGVLELAKKLHASRKRTAEGEAILVPSFDHFLKDPVADGVRIAPEVNIVILEGNWLLYDRAPWQGIAELMDDIWFVDVDPLLARRRVAARHIKSGIEETWDAALARADGNDVLNGEDIRNHLIEPNIRIESIEMSSQEELL